MNNVACAKKIIPHLQFVQGNIIAVMRDRRDFEIRLVLAPRYKDMEPFASRVFSKIKKAHFEFDRSSSTGAAAI